jgi:hypothetical protein
MVMWPLARTRQRADLVAICPGVRADWATQSFPRRVVMSDTTNRQVSGEIEDAYAEIGRTVVETAVQQARTAGSTSEEGIEATVTIRLLFEGGTAQRLPVTCCVCTRDTEGVWVCAGPCCPTRNPPW